MSDHVTTIKNVYDSFLKGDIAGILDQVDENVAWEQWNTPNSAQAKGVPWLLPRNGKEGVMEFFKVVSTMKFNDFRILSIMGNESQVAAEIYIDADMPSGKNLKEEEMHLWSFNDQGKIIRMRHYGDLARHVEAAGL